MIDDAGVHGFDQGPIVQIAVGRTFADTNDFADLGRCQRDGRARAFRRPFGQAHEPFSAIKARMGLLAIPLFQRLSDEAFPVRNHIGPNIGAQTGAVRVAVPHKVFLPGLAGQIGIDRLKVGKRHDQHHIGQICEEFLGQRLGQNGLGMCLGHEFAVDVRQKPPTPRWLRESPARQALSYRTYELTKRESAFRVACRAPDNRRRWRR